MAADQAVSVTKGRIVDFQAAYRKMRPSERPLHLRLSQVVANWIADRRSDGRQQQGVDTYETVFYRFITFAADCPIRAINEALVKAYKRDLMSRVAAGTARQNLTVVRAFCSWCVSEQYLDYNPALAVPHPRVTPPDPDPLSRAGIADLLAALDKPQFSHKYTRNRNRRAVCLMLYAGLRLGEVSKLERRDIDLDRRTITVRREVAKGGMPRVVPVGDELATELESIRSYRPTWAIVDHGDVPGKQGKSMATKSVAHVFERWLPLRGLTIHAHQLRKTFATELYLRGEDIATIQRLLGHADPKTTMRYIAASALKEHDAVQKLTFRKEQQGSESKKR